MFHILGQLSVKYKIQGRFELEDLLKIPMLNFSYVIGPSCVIQPTYSKWYLFLFAMAIHWICIWLLDLSFECEFGVWSFRLEKITEECIKNAFIACTVQDRG